VPLKQFQKFVSERLRLPPKFQQHADGDQVCSLIATGWCFWGKADAQGFGGGFKVSAYA
jgi:hypothetical protein